MNGMDAWQERENLRIKDGTAMTGLSSLPMWQQIQFGLLMSKLSDWRDADHEDSIWICRSDVIAIIDAMRALRCAQLVSPADKTPIENKGAGQ